MRAGFTIQLLEERIGYHFLNVSLLKQALTHSSFSNEKKIHREDNYERLEFLGDAVLEMVTSAFLFFEHPHMPEGELTKLRASMVCGSSLAVCARKLQIGEFILLGKGEEMGGGRDRESIISDVMEAVIGAIYLDGGYEAAKAFIYSVVFLGLDTKQLFYDSKTSLQELVQGKLKREFHYELISEIGPEHDKTFSVEIIMESEKIGRGLGRTKKAAEQQAAYQALLFLHEKGVR